MNNRYNIPKQVKRDKDIIDDNIKSIIDDMEKQINTSSVKRSIKDSLGDKLDKLRTISHSIDSYKDKTIQVTYFSKYELREGFDETGTSFCWMIVDGRYKYRRKPNGSLTDWDTCDKKGGTPYDVDFDTIFSKEPWEEN